MGVRGKIPGVRSEKRTVRWASYIGYAFLVLIIVGLAAPSEDTSTSNPATSNNQESALVEAPATDIVVQGDDLSTEWEYEEITGNGTQASRSASFVDADMQQGYTLENTIMVFNSTETARQHYEGIVNPIKEERGYKELSLTFGKDSFGDASFAYRPSETRQINYIYFYKENVFVKLSLASSSMMNTKKNALFDAAAAIDKRLQ